MATFKAMIMLAMVSLALALPTGTMPGHSIQRDTLKEEPIVPRDYAFNYDILDGFAGMTHARSEVQRNGVVKGFYRYNRPDGVLVTVTYTADETGFHPVIAEEAAPTLRSSSAVHTMYSSDHPEQIKVTLTEDDVELTRRKPDATIVAASASKSRARSQESWSSDSSSVKSKVESISHSINEEVARSSRMFPLSSTVTRRRFSSE